MLVFEFCAEKLTYIDKAIAAGQVALNCATTWQ